MANDNELIGWAGGLGTLLGSAMGALFIWKRAVPSKDLGTIYSRLGQAESDIKVLQEQQRQTEKMDAKLDQIDARTVRIETILESRSKTR